MSERIILGIDPGLHTGYGVIRVAGRHLEMLACGCIQPSANAMNSQRHRVIFEEMARIVAHWKPQAVAVELQFIGFNKTSGIKLGIARGIVTLAATLQEIPVYGYAPVRIKKAVVGNGKADKKQVGKMVKLLLSLSSEIESEDAADALGAAICHSHVWQTNQHEQYQI